VRRFWDLLAILNRARIPRGVSFDPLSGPIQLVMAEHG
jgi:hypothetical protein